MLMKLENLKKMMMKIIKNLILAIVCTVSSIACSAQFYMHASTAQIGTWSVSADDWIWEEPANCNIAIKIKGNLIKVKDKADSYYITYDIISEEDNEAIWEALDEQEKPCNVVITVVDEIDYLIIVYPQICFRYQTIND